MGKAYWIKVNEHMWKKDAETGLVDEYAWEQGYHSGPVCELCGAHPCINCEPDWANSRCDKTSFKCSACGNHVKEEKNYCDFCGEKMIREKESKETVIPPGMQKYTVSIAVDGRADVHVIANSFEDAKVKACEEIYDVDFGALECIDWHAVNAEREDGKFTDY